MSNESRKTEYQLQHSSSIELLISELRWERDSLQPTSWRLRGGAWRTSVDSSIPPTLSAEAAAFVLPECKPKFMCRFAAACTVELKKTLTLPFIFQFIAVFHSSSAIICELFVRYYTCSSLTAGAGRTERSFQSRKRINPSPATGLYRDTSVCAMVWRLCRNTFQTRGCYGCFLFAQEGSGWVDVDVWAVRVFIVQLCRKKLLISDVCLLEVNEWKLNVLWIERNWKIERN